MNSFYNMVGIPFIDIDGVEIDAKDLSVSIRAIHPGAGARGDSITIFGSTNPATYNDITNQNVVPLFVLPTGAIVIAPGPGIISYNAAETFTLNGSYATTGALAEPIPGLLNGMTLDLLLEAVPVTVTFIVPGDEVNRAAVCARIDADTGLVGFATDVGGEVVLTGMVGATYFSILSTSTALGVLPFQPAGTTVLYDGVNFREIRAAEILTGEFKRVTIHVSNTGLNDINVRMRGSVDNGTAWDTPIPGLADYVLSAGEGSVVAFEDIFHSVKVSVQMVLSTNSTTVLSKTIKSST